jgi:hypothetical protein
VGFVEILLGIRSFELSSKFMIISEDFLGMAEGLFQFNFGSSETNKVGKNLHVFDDRKILVFLRLLCLVFV